MKFLTFLGAAPSFCFLNIKIRFDFKTSSHEMAKRFATRLIAFLYFQIKFILSFEHFSTQMHTTD